MLRKAAAAERDALPTTGAFAGVPAGVIVADDLTGAADACAMFVARGCPGVVAFDPVTIDPVTFEATAFEATAFDASPFAGTLNAAPLNAATFNPAPFDAAIVGPGTRDSGTLDPRPSDRRPSDPHPPEPHRSGLHRSEPHLSEPHPSELHRSERHPFKLGTSGPGASTAASRASESPAGWLAISTDTRALSAARAADRVREVVRHVRLRYAPARAFKKIDSTMRGHVGAEIMAAMEAWDARVAIVAPAFPAMGRTVEDGVLRVTGLGSPPPCHVTARLESQGVGNCQRIARPDGARPDSARPDGAPPDGARPDGAHPEGARSDEGDAPATAATRDATRDGGARARMDAGATDRHAAPTIAAWRDAMTTAVRRGGRVLVCDATTDADLNAIVDAGATLQGPILWVGSSGLADALARNVSPSRTDSASRDDASEIEASRRHRAPSGDQASSHDRPSSAKSAMETDADADADAMSSGQHTRARHAPPVAADHVQFGAIVFWIGSDHPVTLSQQQYLLSGPAAGTIEAAAVEDVDRISACLDRGAHAFVDIGPTASTDAIERLVRVVVDKPVGGFVLSGGDTAARICRLLGATRIQLGGEVRRGIPWGWLVTRAGLHWPVVLKSGGFGDERALHDVLLFLSRQEDVHA